jgi:hypothetical protein
MIQFVIKDEKQEMYLAKESHIGKWTSQIKYAKKFSDYANANSERKLLSFFGAYIKNLIIIEVKKNDTISI